MHFDEVLRLAARIGSGEYDQIELDRFLDFIKSADAAQINRILEVYKSSLDQLQSFQLKTTPDFMQRLRSLRPEVHTGTVAEEVTEMTGLIKKPAIFRMGRVAAAAIVLLIFSGFYFYFQNKKEKTIPVARLPLDIKAPKTNRATITLAGGQSIYLDSAANGTLATLGNIQVQKLSDGQIAYSGTTTEISYNTLTNPRGSKPISMFLSDGTKIWLNSGSSLIYPVAFTGKERNVKITGEAYFEVAHNESMPFTVSKLYDDTKVEVLGTHFNVNAYDDETAIKVTLLQGSVKVSKDNNELLLSPDQQAEVRAGKIILNKGVDMEEVMAWKNGKFQFGDATEIGVIMRQIARWYDVEVEFKGEISGKIGGSISRDVNASQVLKMLETTGVIQYKIQGNRVIVMPGKP